MNAQVRSSEHNTMSSLDITRYCCVITEPGNKLESYSVISGIHERYIEVKTYSVVLYERLARGTSIHGLGAILGHGDLQSGLTCNWRSTSMAQGSFSCRITDAADEC